MSDLIRRSVLLKAFNDKNIQITFDLPVEEVLGEDVDLDDFAMLVQDAIQAYKKMVIDSIKNQPTAYDIDKVVEELRENASRYTKKYTTPYGNNGYKDTKAISIHKAIEIVKQGCVSDDVCEWKVFDNSLTDEPQWVYETTCGKYAGEEHTSKAFAYCPCCGKKIKIVGD